MRNLRNLQEKKIVSILISKKKGKSVAISVDTCGRLPQMLKCKGNTNVSQWDSRPSLVGQVMVFHQQPHLIFIHFKALMIFFSFS